MATLSLSSTLPQRSPTVLPPGTGFMEDNFSMGWAGWGWGRVRFRDDSRALHLLCAVFLFCGNLRMRCPDFRVRVHAPMRIKCCCWFERRQNLGGNVSKEEQMKLPPSPTSPPAVWPGVGGLGPLLHPSQPWALFSFTKCLSLWLNETTERARRNCRNHLQKIHSNFTSNKIGSHN